MRMALVLVFALTGCATVHPNRVARRQEVKADTRAATVDTMHTPDRDSVEDERTGEQQLKTPDSLSHHPE